MAIECATSVAVNEPRINQEQPGPLVFDASKLKFEREIPNQFVWPDDEKPAECLPQLHIPSIDLQRVLSGDQAALDEAIGLIGEACRKHGFFIVVNHGVDPKLINETHKYIEEYFGLPLSMKQKARRIPGENYGYASSFTERFNCKLPWKETLSFRYCTDKNLENIVQDYLCEKMGEEYRQFGKVSQKYCESMNEVGLKILELLGLSLGVDRDHFKNLYEENDSILRLNYYPQCQQPEQTLGTGPHCDPTSLTILHQDQVDGLQVFVDDEWRFVSPDPNAFVVNIGDTFMALTNGIFKSCLHRAVVNSTLSRRSIAFFLCPKLDKVLTPPKELINDEHPRQYPDFTWKMLLEFTQKHYRADMNTLDAFAASLVEKNKQISD